MGTMEDEGGLPVLLFYLLNQTWFGNAVAVAAAVAAAGRIVFGDYIIVSIPFLVCHYSV